MPDDPQGKRSLPAPKHPLGLPALDDGPAYIAPAIDVRPVSRASLLAIESPLESPPSSHGRDVPFTLPLPVEERESSMPPPPQTTPLGDRLPDALRARSDPDEAAPESAAPETVDWDRIAEAKRAVPREEEEVPAQIARLSPATHALDVEEREALARDLQAVGELDSQPDRGVERTIAARATLSRARALRFRLALLSAWNADTVPPTPRPARALHFDLALDTALLLVIADGAPQRDPHVDALAGSVQVLVNTLRALRPELPRLALRDRATSAIARLTIGGYTASLAQLAKMAAAVPEEGRVIALEVAAAVAVVPRVDPIRLDALHDLEKALGLPLGCVAPAILEARRAR